MTLRAWDDHHERTLRTIRRLVAERNRPRMPWDRPLSPAERARLDDAIGAYDGAEELAEQRRERQALDAWEAGIPQRLEAVGRGLVAAEEAAEAELECAAGLEREWAAWEALTGESRAAMRARVAEAARRAEEQWAAARRAEEQWAARSGEEGTNAE